MDETVYPHWLCANLTPGVWEHQDLGLCFEELFLLIPIHLLLAVLAAIFGLISYRARLFLGSYSRVFHVRHALTGLSLLAWLALIVGTAAIPSHRSTHVHMLLGAAGILGWTAVAAHDHCHSRSPVYSSRGAPALLLTKCVLVLLLLVWCRSVVLQTGGAPLLITVSVVQSTAASLYLLTHVARYRVSRSRAMLLRNGGPSSSPGPPGVTQHVQGYENDLARLMSAPGGEELLQNTHRLSRPLGNLYGESSCLARLFFSWVDALMARGSREPETGGPGLGGLGGGTGAGLDSLDDLPTLPKELDTVEVTTRFAEAQEMVRERGRTRLLLWSLYASFGPGYFALGILKLLADMLGFVGPIMLNLLVQFLEQDEPMWHGAVYAASMFLSVLLAAFCVAHFDFLISMTVIRVKTAIVGDLSRRMLCVRASEMGEHDAGKLVDLATVDVDRVTNFCSSFHQFWSLPLQIIVAMLLLFQQVHLASLAGLGFAIIMIPINRVVANKIGDYSTAMMSAKDARVKLMSELLAGIRSVKLLHWEEVMALAVDKYRKEELIALKWRKYLDAACVYFWATTPVLIAILTFLTYTLMGYELTAPKVFTTLALMAMLVGPLNAFPWVINGLVESWVSLKRLEAFCRLPTERRLSALFSPASISGTTDLWDSVADLNRPSVVTMYDACFTWAASNDSSRTGLDQEQLEEQLCPLQDITLEINRGQFIGLAGEVASGKTSLLLALLGELRHTKGAYENKFLAPGVRVAYVSQDPWLQRGSVRDNILCGQPYDRHWYERVIEACALTSDIEAMPQRDFTEVGERGTNLSGGQRMRVSLSRAAYLRAELYLLDDPFSSLDAPVCRHVIEECLLNVLAERTIVVATHNLACLERADKVFFMKQGRVIDSAHGSFVISRFSAPSLASLNTPDVVSTAETPPDLIVDSGPLDATPLTSPPTGIEEIALEETEVVVEASSGDEWKEVGSLKPEVYWTYVRAAGVLLVLVLLLAMLLMQGTRNAADWWVASWTAISSSPSPADLSLAERLTDALTRAFHQPLSNATEPSVSYFLTVYGIIVAANSLFTLIRAFLFAYGGIRAARAIHRRLLRRILRAPVTFFEATPAGRILNRFASDLYTVDDSLPFQLNIFLAQLFGLIGALAVTCYALPWIGVVIVPTAAIYWIVQNHYRMTSRELKRLNSLSLSPFYCHLTECISGLIVIRAARQSLSFHNTALYRLTGVQTASFSCNAAVAWLNLRLQLLGVAVVGGVAAVAVTGRYLGWSEPQLAGLALTYSLSLTGLMGGVVRAVTDSEREMVAVERCREYMDDVPEEDDASEPLAELPSGWPGAGELVFDRVSMRYRVDHPLALNDLSLRLRPGERLGVVGRTGSGKSSLVRCLLRTVRHHAGEIRVDGVSVARVPLAVLRDRVTVIPQEPFLFGASLRENVDPRGRLSEEDLQRVMRDCCLSSVMRDIGGIDTPLADAAKQLSAGQKQLVCLARAMARRSRIICLDEATASVDVDTEAMIMTALNRYFSHVTILLIAHRLRTVYNHCDRVAVMARGQLLEVGVPRELDARPDSIFHHMFSREQQSDS